MKKIIVLLLTFVIIINCIIPTGNFVYAANSELTINLSENYEFDGYGKIEIDGSVSLSGEYAGSTLTWENDAWECAGDPSLEKGIINTIITYTLNTGSKYYLSRIAGGAPTIPVACMQPEIYKYEYMKLNEDGLDDKCSELYYVGGVTTGYGGIIEAGNFMENLAASDGEMQFDVNIVHFFGEKPVSQQDILDERKDSSFAIDNETEVLYTQSIVINRQNLLDQINEVRANANEKLDSKNKLEPKKFDSFEEFINILKAIRDNNGETVDIIQFNMANDDEQEKTIELENIDDMGAVYFQVDKNGTYLLQSYNTINNYMNDNICEIYRLPEFGRALKKGTNNEYKLLRAVKKVDGEDDKYESYSEYIFEPAYPCVLVDRDENDAGQEGSKATYKVYIVGVIENVGTIESSGTIVGSILKLTKLSDDLYETWENPYDNSQPQPPPVKRVEISREETDASIFQRIITFFLVIIGDGVLWLVKLVLGQSITIDSILFDKYDSIKLSFFEGSGNTIGYNPLIDGSETGIRGILNEYFSFFRDLAIVSYLVILVYMAIKVLLSGTAASRAQWKDIIFYWLKGVVILFLFPYIIKYTILINHLLVSYISEVALGNESHMVGAVEVEPTVGGLDIPIDFGGKNLDTKSDYMSKMRRKALDEGYIVYAICWLVMIIQLITFIFIYLKRLIMIMFLIAIFPLVTITYAIDCLNDGKAQAFTNWFKEFILNVFLQSFQAINYAIVMGIVLSLGIDNWLLIVVGITYVTKGEELLRKLFGQDKGGGAGTVTSAVKSAAMTKAYTNILRNTTTKLKNTFGKGGTVSQRRLNKYNSQILRAEKNEAKFDSRMFADANSLRNLQSNIGSQINIIFNASSSGREISGALDRLREFSTNSNARQAFNNEINKLSKAQQNELNGLLRENVALNVVEQRNKFTDVTFNNQIDIINDSIRRGGRFEKLARARGYTSSAMSKEYQKNFITSAVKINTDKNKTVRFKTGSSGKHKISQARRTARMSSGGTATGGSTYTGSGSTGVNPSGATRSGGTRVGPGRATRSGGTRVGPGGTTRSGSTGVNPSGATRSGSAGSGSRRTTRGGGATPASAPSYQSATRIINDAASKKRAVKQAAERRKIQMRTTSTEEMQRKRTEKKIEKQREETLKYATKSIDQNETTRKLDSKPADERASYTDLANSIAVINEARNGTVPINVLHDAVATYERESSRGYEYTTDIVSACNYKLEDFKRVLAVETINHSDKLKGTDEEKQKIVDEAIRLLRQVQGENTELGNAMLSKLDFDLDSLKEGYMPVIHYDPRRVDRSGIVQKDYDVTVEDYANYAKLKKLQYSDSRAARIQGAVGTVTEAAGGTIGATVSSAFTAASGASGKDVIATMLAGGTTLSEATGNVVRNVVGGADDIISTVTRRQEKIDSLSGSEEVIKIYGNPRRKRPSSEKLQSRATVIVSDRKGRQTLEERTDTDYLGRKKKNSKKLF